MVEVVVLGTDGSEFGFGACATAYSPAETAEMIRQLADLKFPGEVRVVYRDLEEGLDPDVAAKVRAGDAELPVVLVDGELAFSGGAPWLDLQERLAEKIGRR
jgi:disulfide oxidoreductase YuzD